jgi:hypothetical protein
LSPDIACGKYGILRLGLSYTLFENAGSRFVFDHVIENIKVELEHFSSSASRTAKCHEAT